MPVGSVEVGVRLRDYGIDRAEIGAGLWMDFGVDSLFKVASSMQFFTGDDVWADLVARKVPAPREPRAMGAVFRRARGAGWIVPTEVFRPSVRPEAHRCPSRVWRSVIYG